MIDHETVPVSEPKSRWHTRNLVRDLVIIAAVVLVGWAWTLGTFDNFLWRVHLNAKTCATNGFGATFCGDQLEEYQQRIGN